MTLSIEVLGSLLASSGRFALLCFASPGLEFLVLMASLLAGGLPAGFQVFAGFADLLDALRERQEMMWMKVSLL